MGVFRIISVILFLLVFGYCIRFHLLLLKANYFRGLAFTFLSDVSIQLAGARLTITIDRSLARAVARSLIARSVARSLDRSNARSLVRSVARSLDRSLDRSIARSLDRSIGRSLDRSIARSLGRSVASKIPPSVYGASFLTDSPSAGAATDNSLQQDYLTCDGAFE